MKRAGEVTREQVKAVMERGQLVPHAPNVVRARLLARARAALAAPDVAPMGVPVPVISLRSGSFRFALAAGVVLVLAAAGATAAYRAWTNDAPQIAPVFTPNPVAAPIRAATPLPKVKPTVSPPAEPSSSSTGQRSRRPISPQESYAAELRLLQGAQSDYKSHDFSAALGLVAEHARRFPNGRLAEEREALRVRSLVGAGRAEDARRAYAVFARRFPHSVLLPRLEQSATSAGE